MIVAFPITGHDPNFISTTAELSFETLIPSAANPSIVTFIEYIPSVFIS